MNSTKPGWQTTEAYATLITIILGILLSKLGFSDEQKKQLIPQLVPIVVTLVAGLGYIVSRTLVKIHAVAPPAPVPAIAAGAPTQQIPAEQTGQIKVTDLTPEGTT